MYIYNIAKGSCWPIQVYAGFGSSAPKRILDMARKLITCSELLFSSRPSVTIAFALACAGLLAHSLIFWGGFL